MKKLHVDGFVAGHEVDNAYLDRVEVLMTLFRGKAQQLLEARRGIGGTFRISLEWTPEPKPKEGK